ncbi:MAG: YceI family protein [Pseudomonadota bacterium]
MTRYIQRLALLASVLGLFTLMSAMGETETLDDATWFLASDASSLNFISVKNEDIGETHAFQSLRGSIDPDGNARLVVDLTSVETGIDIRNQRMKELFFEVGRYGEASFFLKVATALKSIPPGAHEAVDVIGSLNLHGETVALEASLIVNRLSETRVAVSSLTPILVHTEDFKLVEGLNRLRTIAGLDSIQPLVPVTFNLVFEASEEGVMLRDLDGGALGAPAGS